MNNPNNFKNQLKRIQSHLNLCVISCCTSITFNKQQSIDELDRLVAELSHFRSHTETQEDINTLKEIALVVETFSWLIKLRFDSIEKSDT